MHENIIGLEPADVYVRDYPAKVTFHEGLHPERIGIEGFYLLRSLPDFSVEWIPEPAEFGAGCAAAVSRTVVAVGEIYKDDPAVIKSWNEWYEVYGPKTDFAIDMVTQLRSKRKLYKVSLVHTVNHRVTYDTGIACMLSRYHCENYLRVNLWWSNPSGTTTLVPWVSLTMRDQHLYQTDY